MPCLALLPRQPFYTLLDSKRVEFITPAKLQEDVRSKDGDCAWVVLLAAPWHSACRVMAPVFTDLAERYATDRLRFVVLDVGEFSK